MGKEFKGWGLILLGVGGLFLAWYLTKMSPAQERQAVTDWAKTRSGDNSAAIAVLPSLTDAEINQLYEFIFDWFNKGTAPAPDSPMGIQILQLDAKYPALPGLFT